VLKNMNRRKFFVTSSLLLGSVFYGGLYWKNRWKYIVIHHSAGSFGNLEFFRKVHRQRQAKDPINAISYHYIIGNGNGLAMGEVASDWRQSYDIWGAHVSMNNLDYNFRGIGVCLVGNFENKEVPSIQYQSLLRLTKSLMSKYDISHSNVTGHRMIKGESTKCPGKYFPMKTFKTDIA
jgi:N-acetyl-anhydromuramyl-L-alanine amidase AmpD